MYYVRIRSIEGNSTIEYAELFDAVKYFVEVTGNKSTTEINEEWNVCDNQLQGLTYDSGSGEYYVDLWKGL